MENDGYVYFWYLVNFQKNTLPGLGSMKSFEELSCNAPIKIRSLSSSWHIKEWGEGTPKVSTGEGKWKYPPPESVINELVKNTCKLILEKKLKDF